MNQCKKALDEQLDYSYLLQKLMSELDIGLKCKESFSEEEVLKLL